MHNRVLGKIDVRIRTVGTKNTHVFAYSEPIYDRLRLGHTFGVIVRDRYARTGNAMKQNRAERANSAAYAKNIVVFGDVRQNNFTLDNSAIISRRQPIDKTRFGCKTFDFVSKIRYFQLKPPEK